MIRHADSAAGMAGQPLVRLRLDLAYDGSGFSGWAAQPGRRTVQAVVEEALGRVLRVPAPPRLTVAGRTDAGVHARGQVAHADVPAQSWAPVADTAVYRVCDEPAAADPVRRNETLWHPRRLDLALMNAAARACLGNHDFAAFCRRREGATTVRTLLRLDWARDGDGVAVAVVEANAFCHNMVRALVGALLAVGDGRRPPEWPGQVLAAGIRDPGVHVAPPHGLCLEDVRYPF